MDLTHASWFSGIGAVDVGLERAGWRTVSHSEIEPYANAVLAAHWPGVPNLGDITAEPEPPEALLWTGGFPCQDLSVAGRRAGFAGERSSLAFAFLDLVGRHHPAAILLENVPGIFSSNGGRDFGALLEAMVELGYGVAWRELDAQHFDVPQRRRRVFILGLRHGADDPDGHLAAERAGEVLAVGTVCERHPPTGRAARAQSARGTVGSLTGSSSRAGWRIGSDEAAAGHLVGPPPDAGRDGAPDGPAGRLDAGPELAPALTAPEPRHRFVEGRRQDGGRRDRVPITYFVAPETGQGADLTAHEVDVAPAITVTEYERSTDRGVRVLTFAKGRRAQSVEDHETWVESSTTPTINVFDASAARATVAVVQSLDTKGGGPDDNEAQAGHFAVGGDVEDDPLLPPGLDSNRYRCCGNAVVVPVAEWIGQRLAAYFEAHPWEVVPKGNRAAVRLADGHYNRRKVGSPQFMPPGQTLVLLTPDEKAVFGWWRPHPDSGIRQMNGLDGWTCTIFRNTGTTLSSSLILAAERELLERYDVGPDGLLTYVWDSKVQSVNPGYCFKEAGWKRIGRSVDGRKTLLQKLV